MSTDWLKQRDGLLDAVRRGTIERDDLDEILLDLVEAARGGSTTHGDLLVAVLDTSPIVASAIRSLLLDATEIEDAQQEALLAVSRSLGNYRGDAGVTAWAAGIARNKARDVLRRRGRPQAPVPSQSLPTELERFSSQWATRADVDAALDSLSDKLRPVFVLADVHGLTYDEIAERLGIARNTVASRLRRARAQLGMRIAVVGN